MNLSTCILRSGAVFGDGYDKTHFHFRWQARGILVFFWCVESANFYVLFLCVGVGSGWVGGGVGR